jgi:hypothetical protein
MPVFYLIQALTMCIPNVCGLRARVDALRKVSPTLVLQLFMIDRGTKLF